MCERKSLEEKIANLLAYINEELFNWRFDDIDYLGEANKLAERMNTLAKDAVVPSECDTRSVGIINSPKSNQEV